MRPAPRPPKPALHTLRIENAVDDFRAGYAARRSRSRTSEGPPIRTRQQAPLASNRRLIGQDKRGTQRSLRITRSASEPDPPRVAKLHQCKSEERRVGREGGSQCKLRVAAVNEKDKKNR